MPGAGAWEFFRKYHHTIPDNWRTFMIFGMPRLVARVMLLCALSPLALAAGPTWTVFTLLQALSHSPNHKVHFVETNHIASLSRPIHMHGELEYQPPDVLIMKQSAPRKAVYRIEGDRLFVNHSRRGVPVGRYPGVVAIVSGFMGLLSGNHALLAHDFAMTLSGNAERWQLTLRPRLASLRQAVTSVVVTGHKGQLVEITSRAPDGDFSVMRIVP